MEEVTEKTEKCPKWNIKYLEIFCLPCTYSLVPLNYGLIAAPRALIVVRYHLDQNDMRTKSYRGGKSSVILEGAIIFCFQCADLSMTFWLWKFQKKWLNIEYEMASYAIWHSWTLTLYPPTSVCIFFILFLIHFQRGWQGEFV